MKQAHYFGWMSMVSLVYLGAAGCSAGAPDESIGEQQDELARARICEGPRHLGCAKNEFCDSVRPGRCPGEHQIGMCTKRPEVCTYIFDPVCGCDGNTYPNACSAAAVGVAVASRGECETDGQFCGGIAGIPCPDGQTCVDDPSDGCDPANGGADCGGVCVVKTNPCAAVLCPVGSECVVEGNTAKCVPQTCGDTVCGPGLVCCNPLRSICTLPGRVCIF